MKQFILSSFFLALTSISFSQIYFPQELVNEPDPKTGYGFSFKDIEIGSIERTFFVYKNQDEDYLESMKELMTANWKHSEMQLISYEDYKLLETKMHDVIFNIDFSYMVTQWSDQTGASAGADVNSVNFGLGAIYIDSDNSKKVIGSLSLAAEESIIVDVCSKKKSKEQLLDEIYDKGVFYNWDLSLLSNFVGLCSRRVESESGFTGMAPKSELAKVKSAKLYISDAVNVELLRLQNKDVLVDNSEGIKKNYPYKFEIVSQKELNNLAIEEAEGYVLYYIRCGEDKKFLIMDLKTGDILYTFSGKKYEYNFKLGDIKAIAKEIEKA